MNRFSSTILNPGALNLATVAAGSAVVAVVVVGVRGSAS
jgi:hypothetical protein